MKRNSWLYHWLKGIKNDIDLAKFKVEWNKRNEHNETYPGEIYPADRVKVGNMTYGELNVFGFDRPDTTLTIGSYCSLAGNIQFWVGGEHPTKYLSTFPFAHKYGWTERLHPELASKGSIVVKDDVWIGEGAIILSGVTIGQGAIVGAGSVVTKDIPPYCVWVGNKIIKKRFPENIIALLEKIDLNNISMEQYRKLADTEITEKNAEDFLQRLRSS